MYLTCGARFEEFFSLFQCDGLRNRIIVYVDNNEHSKEDYSMGKYTKSFQDRREELRQALYRIDGAIERYKQNSEIAELGIIAMELRGLLFGEALFISLSEERDFPLDFYMIPTTLMDMDADMRRGLTHAWSADSVSLTCKKPWTQKVAVKQWFETPIAEIKGTVITPMRLISEIANHLGPAHYSSEISNALLEMKQFNLGGVPSYFRTLLRFAECLLELGKKFLATY